MILSCPRSYRNCMKYLNEQYPKHQRVYHANWHSDCSLYLIERVEIDDSEINILINISILAMESEDVIYYKRFLNYVQQSNLESKFISYWLFIYTSAIYPELIPVSNNAFKDGEMFFSSYDYDVRTLASVEHLILQHFGQYRLSILLDYIDNFSGSILGKVKLDDILGAGSTDAKGITGKIIFRMLTQESTGTLKKIINEVRQLLYKISSDLQLIFSGVVVIADNGLETFNIGQKLGRQCLSGSYYQEKIA